MKKSENRKEEKEGTAEEANEKKEATDKIEDKAAIEEDKKTETPGSGNKAKIVIVAAVISIIILGSLFYLSLISPQNQKNPYQMKFANETLNFRADLNKAALVAATPDDQTIRNAVLSRNVNRIKVSYVPDVRYNGFYAVDSFEITYKLFIIFKYHFGTNGYIYAGDSGENCMFFEETGKRICILSEPIQSENDIKAGNAEIAIFLSAANETSVSLNGNIIYVRGKPDYESNGKYTGLDLATDRLLLALMKE